jgi:DNA-binding response OmpR family regulator
MWGTKVIKLLLVEDDPDMLDLTAYVLRRERFVVAEASDGAQALRRWRADRPDLVILDLGLPTLDGFEVLRQIRGDGQTPILVLTGRRDAQDILRAFNLGTDDFMPKPFEFKELIARIRAVLRRANLSADERGEPQLQLDGLTLDPQTYEVGWRDSNVRLTPTEFRILYLLATNSGKVVPASRMYTYVWGSAGGDANALRSHISHLRRKLEVEVGGDVPGTISSVPAVGYVFRRAPTQATAPAPKATAASAATPAQSAPPAQIAVPQMATAPAVAT